MSDDKHMSQLISKSLRRTLDDSQSNEVKQHLEQNEEARKFKELSELIEQSVSISPAETETVRGAGLSTQAKERLKQSVNEAVQEKLTLSQAGLIEVTQIQPLRASSVNSNRPPEQDQREILSRFKLIRRLGQGGLGNVWLAKDEKLNRNVAIKELKAETLDSEKSWQRFHREAEITGHLEHPNVVPLYQFGVDRTTGEPFYAMRFVGKRTLSDAIIEHHDRVEAGENVSLGLHRLLTVFLDVCQAIAYAHSRGVIHRDLKPENVALDNFGQVIVLDWGLAKVMEDSELSTKMTCESTLSDSCALDQTMEGEVIGTPLYMAPEQATGDLDRIDDKTDVYGLGAMLFAILTGDAPHQRFADNMGGDFKKFLGSISNDPPPNPTDIRSSVPRELANICMKAMALKRHLRYESVQQLSDEVERWMAGQSEKKSGYDNIRMEGRELRADLQSAVDNLERNVRFAAGLPPIDQLIHVTSDEDVAVWRDRLSTIFRGLLQANPDYFSIVYAKIANDEFTEIVRVERLAHGNSNVRLVPKSRLRTEKVNAYIKQVAENKPEDVLTSLVADPLCEKSSGCNEAVGLLSGVPVFDDETEEMFGVIMIHCDIDRILRRQMNRRMTAGEVIVGCDVFHAMMHAKDGHISEQTLMQPIADIAPYFTPAIEKLQTEGEFIDETNSDIYGARIWLIPRKHGLMYLLRRKH